MRYLIGEVVRIGKLTWADDYECTTEHQFYESLKDAMKAEGEAKNFDEAFEYVKKVLNKGKFFRNRE